MVTLFITKDIIPFTCRYLSEHDIIWLRAINKITRAQMDSFDILLVACSLEHPHSYYMCLYNWIKYFPKLDIVRNKLRAYTDGKEIKFTHNVYNSLEIIRLEYCGQYIYIYVLDDEVIGSMCVRQDIAYYVSCAQHCINLYKYISKVYKCVIPERYLTIFHNNIDMWKGTKEYRDYSTLNIHDFLSSPNMVPLLATQ